MAKTKPMLPLHLYLSLATGEIVKEPSFTGWTEGDVRQWKSEHQRYEAAGGPLCVGDLPAKKRGPFTSLLGRELSSIQQQILRSLHDLGHVPVSATYGTPPWSPALGIEAKMQNDAYGDVNDDQDRREREGHKRVWPQTRLDWLTQLGHMLGLQVYAYNHFPPDGKPWTEASLYKAVHTALTTRQRARHPDVGLASIERAMHSFLDRKDLLP